MRVQCTCGHTLADVVDSDYNDYTTCSVNEYLRRNGLHERLWRREDVYLHVHPRINVRMEVYSNVKGPRIAPADRYRRTYSWQCRCYPNGRCRDRKGRRLTPGGRRQDWQRTAEKIALAWDRLGPDAPPGRPKGTVVAVLDQDL